ncbi:Ubiquitin thioesterase otulin [Bagarius yarrelli]|uniref:Ubiquitin thioesterase otulin n=1 Tax=Bagarius yarrelli TaxID=175774 RepID=A0A556TXI1_BAGYA|nr:Ubiquitin thioesterase otulin [Bagarius yarrelli]
MGNSLCCPTSNPCDHTVDETQGLLNSPDSKVLARLLTTDGISQALEAEESSKNKAECIKQNQEQDVVTTQTIAASNSAKEAVQSSYGSVIQSLHTDVSLSAQTNQSASPVLKATEEQADAATTITETKEEDETTIESHDSATEVSEALHDTASTELATAEVNKETEAQITDEVEKEKKSDESKLIIQDATTEIISDEMDNVQVDMHKDLIEKETEEFDKNKDFPEFDRKQEAGAIDTEQKELVEVSSLIATLQTNEPVLNNSEIDEEKGPLTPNNISEKSADALLPKKSIAELLVSLSEPSETETEQPTEKSVANNVLENHEEHFVSNLSAIKEESVPPKAQKTSEQDSTPTVTISKESTVNYVKNDQENDFYCGDLNDETTADVVEVPFMEKRLEKPFEEPSNVKNQELMCEPPGINKSGSISLEVEKPELARTAEAQKTISECIQKEDVKEDAIPNGLFTCAPKEESEPGENLDEPDDVNEPEIKATGSTEAFSMDHNLTEEKSAPEASENDEITAEDEKEIAETNQAQKEEIIFSSSHDMKVTLIPLSDIENIAEKEAEHSDSEDLYQGDDEIKQGHVQDNMKLKPILEFTIPGVEDKCSLAAPVDILVYSEKEWKGNTSKSNIIRKGYSKIYCSFTKLRRVRGDNYCSLRATLYQVLATTTRTPAWLLEEDFTSLPEKFEAQEHLIGLWVFPSQCIKAGETTDAVEKLKHYLELLQKRWQAAAESEALEEKLSLCDQVFQGGEEEYGLLEVLKFLMLVKAVEFHRKMQADQEVPVFCWLLFARDTSENPEMFFSNHLSQVGFSGGLEQVEMFLLGYALQHTIQAFRLYKTDTEEFVTHYPDDHKHDWPCVCIITEDDRHYNVPVRKPTLYKV